ncbi:Hsp20/alpha crystallin family protein [Spirosoma spitsbergense]|uniref:Hsp20/alpha crystallin family protein n=1 Tax=Spirosoma spitsbergense TaxID=431554 RepID=UPI0003644A80|nr:Hsp20/alpha crystallin family protein [Spirosoma spitsbergense]
MYNKQAFESEHKGGCGSWGGRSKFGGSWGGPAFGRGTFGGRGHRAWGAHRPPVNIEETDTEYVIALYAAGLVKEKVSLTVKDDVLTISYAPDSAGKTETGNTTYQEFSTHSFERSFKLNNKVLIESISATYTDGILKITLPKNPATNVPAQTITVG